MKKVNVFVYSLIICLMILILIIINTDILGTADCYNHEKFASTSADGKVVSKYVDTHNHNYKRVQVKNENGTYSNFNLTFHWNRELYDSLEVGYSIRKGEGETRVFYGEEALNNMIDIRFNCDTTNK